VEGVEGDDGVVTAVVSGDGCRILTNRAINAPVKFPVIAIIAESTAGSA